MGPSGSGKSTLLHVIGGLEPPTSGQIWLDGQRADRLSAGRLGGAPPARHRHRLPGRQPAVHHDRRGQRRASRAARGRDRAARPAHAGRSCLEELGLAAKARAAPARLSGGEQQKVALARALANKPSLLLADEPTGNLDSTSTTEVLKVLRHAHTQGQAIVLVTHDARVASHADRIVNVFDGMICDDAPAAVPGARRPDGTSPLSLLRWS